MYVKGYPDIVEEGTLHEARNIFEANKKYLGCSKCSSLLSFRLSELFGDLQQARSETVVAEEQYLVAFAELNGNLWKSQISFPEDGSSDANEADFEWRCHTTEVIKSKSLSNYIDLKWECIRRQLLMGLNTRLVKCGGDDEIDKAGNILLRSTNCLLRRNLFCTTFDSISKDSFDRLVAVEFLSDIFVIQRVEIILDVCWYSLKNFCSEFGSKLFCDLSSIKAAQIVSWLKVAFVLSREMPFVIQKVSKLLAVLYVVSCSSKQLSLSSNEDDVAENCWAAYFHQASFGRYITRDFQLYSARRCASLSDAGSSSIGPDTFESLWLVPKATKDLAKHVKKFLVGIPSATITSICILGMDYTMLRQLPISPCLPEHTRALMLLSRLSFGNEPIVILLPVDSISQDVENLKDMDESATRDTVIDDLLPSFRTIVEEGTIYADKELQRRRREKLDLCLGTLLSKVEENWFGSWKSLLLGECLNTNAFDQWLESFAMNQTKNQRPMCKLTECLLKILLGGDGKKLGSKLSSDKPCYIAKIGYDAWCKTVSDATNDFKLTCEIEVIANVERKPVILVLDEELQIFCWENLPTAREQEMYRMPTVSSIFLTERDPMSMSFPSIDPSNAYYLLDADNEAFIFERTEKIFRSLPLEGKAHTRATVQDLASALETRDLFIYLGHNDGSQYISKKEILNLQICAVVLLMGCQSGKFTCRGKSYASQPPVVISYLLRGSPAVVANLWITQVNEVDSMTAALFEAWLTESSIMSSHKRRIGAFLPRVRKACKYPFLAGLVCYGVPTELCKKSKFHTGQHNERKGKRKYSAIDP